MVVVVQIVEKYSFVKEWTDVLNIGNCIRLKKCMMFREWVLTESVVVGPSYCIY